MGGIMKQIIKTDAKMNHRKLKNIILLSQKEDVRQIARTIQM